MFRGIAELGLSAYLNYALGRVWFYNPIVGGFTTEAAHLTETGRFLAPMDQTHTLTSGLTYRHNRTRLWGARTVEYGSGTPGRPWRTAITSTPMAKRTNTQRAGDCATRCPSHFTQNVSIGWNASSVGTGLVCRFSSTSRTCRTTCTCSRRRARWCRASLPFSSEELFPSNFKTFPFP